MQVDVDSKEPQHTYTCKYICLQTFYYYYSHAIYTLFIRYLHAIYTLFTRYLALCTRYFTRLIDIYLNILGITHKTVFQRIRIWSESHS